MVQLNAEHFTVDEMTVEAFGKKQIYPAKKPEELRAIARSIEQAISANRAALNKPGLVTGIRVLPYYNDQGIEMRPLPSLADKDGDDHVPSDHNAVVATVSLPALRK